MKYRSKGGLFGGAIAAALIMALFIGVALVSADFSRVPGQQNTPHWSQRQAVQSAVEWMVRTHQNDDGGYSSFSMGANLAPSDIGGTIEAMLALSSAGYSSGALAPGQEETPLNYLRQHTEDLATYAAADSGQNGKAIMALVAANQDPRSFEEIDFVAMLLERQSFAGHFDVSTAFSQSLAVLALSAAHEPVAAESVDWLLEQQAADSPLAGSWDDGYGTAGNADATALAVMALRSTGMTLDNERLAAAADFLNATRLETGGWEYGAGFGENVNSTALAVQALSALGLDFYTDVDGSASPISVLLAWQGESGAFQADYGDGRFDDFFATLQAIPAAAGKYFPIQGRYLAAKEAASCLVTLQDLSTGGWEQFAGFGVNAAGTSRAIQAIAAVGDDPTSERYSLTGSNPVQALEALAPAYLAEASGGGVGIVMQGVVAAGGDVNAFAGIDLVLEMSGHLSPTGEYDDTSFGPFSHGEAMLGLISADQAVDQSAVDWLTGAQEDGSWGGADSSGMALQVLGASGVFVSGAVEQLAAIQEIDGGWGYGAADPSSSSEAVQGLTAVGENPFAPFWSQVVSGTLTNAADAIMALQGSSGCWPNLYGDGDDPFGTTDAIMLLTLQPEWGTDREIADAEFYTEESAVSDTESEVDQPEGEAVDAAAEEATAVPTEEAVGESEITAAVEPTPMPAAATSVSEAVDQVGETSKAVAVTEQPEQSESNGVSPAIIVLSLLALAAVGAGIYVKTR